MGRRRLEKKYRSAPISLSESMSTSLSRSESFAYQHTSSLRLSSLPMTEVLPRRNYTRRYNREEATMRRHKVKPGEAHPIRRKSRKPMVKDEKGSSGDLQTYNLASGENNYCILSNRRTLSNGRALSN